MWAMVPFLTYFVEELGIEDPASRNLWTGVLVAAAPIVAALMGPVWGGIGDRFSRKAMVLRATAAIVVFVGLMSFAQSVWVLLVLRLLQGAFSGYVPPSITLVSVQAPVDRQGTVAGIMQAAMHAGAVSGFLLGGQIAAEGAMRGVFPICSALAAIGFFVVLVLVREERRGMPSSGRGLRAIIKGVVDDYRYAFTLRALVRLLICVVAVRTLIATATPSYARYIEHLGGERETVGYVFCAEATVLFLFMPAWGRLIERTGPRHVFALCAVTLAVSYVAQSYAADVEQLVYCRLLSGIGQSGIYPAAYAMASRESHLDRRGSAIGAVFMALALSHGLGSAMGGWFLNEFGFEKLLAVIGSGAFALGAFALWDARRSRHTELDQASP